MQSGAAARFRRDATLLTAPACQPEVATPHGPRPDVVPGAGAVLLVAHPDFRDPVRC